MTENQLSVQWLLTGFEHLETQKDTINTLFKQINTVATNFKSRCTNWQLPIATI